MGIDATKAVKELLTAIAGTHEYYSPPDVDQRTAAWWWGQSDQDIGWAHGICALIAQEPIAQSIYLARVADDTSRYRRLKEWAYKAAVEFAGQRGSAQRRRSLVESYRLDWGHQAARDGLARALWPWMEDEMPGRDARCKQFGCGHQAFQRVRDAVTDRANQAFNDYRSDLENIVDGRWTRDMMDRHETVTGVNWADHRA